jgi:hypothetical protein
MVLLVRKQNVDEAIKDVERIAADMLGIRAVNEPSALGHMLGEPKTE